MALNYDSTWVLDLPALGEGQARVRIGFPSIGALRARSCEGTLEGRVVVPRWTAAGGTEVHEGRCDVERLGDALRFHARLPFRTDHGLAQLSVQCLAYGPPDEETNAHVRLDGIGLGPQEGVTRLHLPRFLATLSTEQESFPPGPRPPALENPAGSWPRLRRQLGQAGWLLGWTRMGLPEDIVKFLRSNVRSVEQLEVLLLLYREPDRWWEPAEIAQSLYASVDSVARSVQRLASNRLAEARGEPATTFRFHPKASERVAELARLYNERRVAVLTAIAMGPMDDVQSFADAFRWRNGEED